jgi:predicted esterase/thiol-disulfide isomerase/thioredoxin
MNSVTNLLLTAAMLLSSVALKASAADVPPDIADMQVQHLRARGDEKMRYFVIHRPIPTPAQGWRTMFVLPGGSGDAQFQPFVTRIAKNALPEGYLVVQLVAPVWTPQQAQNIVWPDDKSGVPEMKFSTKDFFLAVRSEVEAAHKIDPLHCFTLTWSSSGMSGDALSLLPNSGINGTFVAMSVFRPDALPPLNSAKGHPYFLYHSPQDFIPIAQAKAARDALQKAGATVELQTYEGGHGWRGNIFGDIRKGVEWLERQQTMKPGDLSPELAYMSFDDGHVTLLSSKRSGKIVVVRFWTSSSERCLQSLESLQNTAARFANDKDKIEFLTICVDGIGMEAAKMAGAIEEAAALVSRKNWTRTTNGWSSFEDFKEWNISDFPSTYIIGPDGRFISINPEGQLETMINRLLTK